MKILAIETSCDDTCIAIIEVFGKKKPQFKILANVISSQVEIHKKWGGVYPTMAKREHQKNLVPVLKEALGKAKLIRRSKCELRNKKIEILKDILEREELLLENSIKFLNCYKKPNIDLVAVTIGPGLEPCLWSGINFAKTLSFWWRLPLIPVNHIEAHIFANWIRASNESLNVKFPAVCLVASGGHSQIILMGKIGSYRILGETRDDAAGECFDKVARILGLGYPGGPIIEEMASRLKIKDRKLDIKLPRPMIHMKNYDFSFAGLKTAVLYNFRSQPEKIQKSGEYLKMMSAETQQAIIDVLLEKTKKAAKDYKVRSVLMGGGVTANQEFRRQSKRVFSKEKFKLVFPKLNFSTDNAVMVAISAYFNCLKAKTPNKNIERSWKEIVANANQRL